VLYCCVLLQVPRPVPPPPSPAAPEVPTVCNTGEDLVIFTTLANGPLQCDGAAGSGVGDSNTGTVVVSDFSTLSRRGLGWVQAGMVCFDLGCDQGGANSAGAGAGGAAGEWPNGDSDAGNSNFAPTPAPVAVDANMGAPQDSTAASSSSSGSGSSTLSFASKKPTIRQPNTRRAASTGRTLSSTRLSGSPAAGWVPVPYSFASTSTAAAVPIQASVVSSPPASAPAAPQPQCRFAVCKPRGQQQQQWSNAGH
jgi:hypothetical protein